jgi:putative membrane protein
MVNWQHWHNEPLLVGGIVFAGWLYAMLAGPWRERIAPGEPFPTRPAVAFYSGLVLFYLAVGSPLDQIGERFLFFAHMIQHLLLVYPVALLVLIGMPPWMLGLITRPSPAQPALRLITRPLMAAMIYVLVLSAWHVPYLYEVALRDKGWHIVQHLCFFGTAVIMWWPIASPDRHLPASHPGSQILYVFSLGVLQTPLAAFLTFSKEPLYPTYEFAPRLTELSPLEDQIAGGATMAVGGMFLSVAIIAWSFLRWSRDQEPEPRIPRRSRLAAQPSES